MSKNAKVLAHNHTEDEECQDDCPLRPHFRDHVAVQLTCDKYVQLLIEARETDPGCWPPGLEGAARLLERAHHIEEQCAQKHGQFEPELLSKKLGDEYLQIHLALDDLLNTLEEEKIQQAKAQQDKAAPDDELSDQENPVFIEVPGNTWTEVSSHPGTENFA